LSDSKKQFCVFLTKIVSKKNLGICILKIEKKSKKKKFLGAICPSGLFVQGAVCPSGLFVRGLFVYWG
jgi:hypothetical protein